MKQLIPVVISLALIITLSGCTTSMSEDKFNQLVNEVYTIDIEGNKYMSLTIVQKYSSSRYAYAIGILIVENLNASVNYVLTTLNHLGDQSDRDLTGLKIYRLEIDMKEIDENPMPFFSIVLKRWDLDIQNYKSISSIIITSDSNQQKATSGFDIPVMILAVLNLGLFIKLWRNKPRK